jgi:transcriptional regulator with XRE-family HTH domain
MLCRETGISASHMSDILHRRRGVSKERAEALEAACDRLGWEVPFRAWLFSRTTDHPAFLDRNERI